MPTFIAAMDGPTNLNVNIKTSSLPAPSCLLSLASEPLHQTDIQGPDEDICCVLRV